MRTDDNNNPTAFTMDIAIQAGLIRDVDYTVGTKFPAPSNLITAKLLGDPIALTIQVIDKIGYYTHSGVPRWTYIQMPKFVWDMLNFEQKLEVIAFHYKNEGGTALQYLFE